MKEVWKSVVGYEGLYEVSNIGNVRGLDRYETTVKLSALKNTVTQTNLRKGKTRTLSIDKIGYVSINISKNGKQSKGKVHRMVAMAFIDNPDNKPWVNHINGIKTDNRIENLEWCTPMENTHHAYATGLNAGLTGKANGQSQLVLDLQTGIFYDCVAEAFNAQNRYKHHRSLIRAIQQGYTNRYTITQ